MSSVSQNGVLALGSLALIRGQLASARIAPVLGFITIAVALWGEYVAPTPASTCSTSLWSGADSVRCSDLPGSISRTLSTAIVWPRASLTIRRSPARPIKSLLYSDSRPL